MLQMLAHRPDRGPEPRVDEDTFEQRARTDWRSASELCPGAHVLRVALGVPGDADELARDAAERHRLRCVAGEGGFPGERERIARLRERCELHDLAG